MIREGRNEVMSPQTQPGECMHQAIGGLDRHASLASAAKRDEVHLRLENVVGQQTAGEMLRAARKIEERGVQPRPGPR